MGLDAEPVEPSLCPFKVCRTAWEDLVTMETLDLPGVQLGRRKDRSVVVAIILVGW